MNILFLGDIFGRPGRRTIQRVLPDVVSEFQPDIVIGNAENLAGGRGVNKKSIQEMREAGIQVFTGGNHSFENVKGNDVYEDDSLPVLRPANFPSGVPGRGWGIFTARNGERLLLVSLLGRTFMPHHSDSPFHKLDEILSSIPKSDYDASLIDIHAEATSEKQAFLWRYNGKVSAIIGTHTHVPTADAEVSSEGTAFQCDAGMNGSLDSCIGLRSELVIKKLMAQMPLKYEVEDSGRMQFNAVYVETNAHKATKIQFIRKILS